MYGNTKGGVWATPIRKNSNDKLKLHISKFGYKPAPITPCLRRYQTHPLQCSIVVDDFGIKYERQEDITHILDELKNLQDI